MYKLTILLLIFVLGCSNSITIGQTNGEYKEVNAKILEARKFEHIGQKIVTTLVFNHIDIQTAQNRMSLYINSYHEKGTNGIDVLIDATSPLYDKIIEANPKALSMLTIYGTVNQYGNTYDRIYITPEKLIFKK
jgi:hypothetical protein